VSDRDQPGLRLELSTGWIRGESGPADERTGRSLRLFKGIPYAEPPTGALRWQAPQAALAWVGERVCHHFGRQPLQAAADPDGRSGAAYVGDLDCLSLNVWCPPLGEGPWPVIVWIPGGGFMRGGAADPLYDGSAMAREGLVFVSINYRIGVDGFMHFDDDAAPNRGLQDQLAALRWVREHIAVFGGDVSRVTVAGVSAGAGAIGHLMGLAESDTLFSRVILQSPSLQTHDLEDARRIRHAVAGVLGVTPDRAGLAGVPFGPLTRALASFLDNAPLKQQWGIRARNYFPVRPVIDGKFLHDQPLVAVQARLAHGGLRRPVLLGCNAHEMNFYLAPNGGLDRVDTNALRDWVNDLDGAPDALLQRYREWAPQASPGELLSQIQSDYYYRQPAQALAEGLRQAGCLTYVYEFGWCSPLHGGRMGAAHAMEIPFVLGNTGSARAREFIGGVAPAGLALRMQTNWVQFVRGETLHPWTPDVRGVQSLA
jgi:para-nitrobenzyl esterase